MTRRRPYTSRTKPETVARSAPIPNSALIFFELLEIQMLVDVQVVERIANDDGECTKVWPVIGFIESPSYDWYRHQALCERFEAERRRRRQPQSAAKAGAPRFSRDK